mmetsp:Transcript_26768/g.69283  ORF Transcript_26768/g.69283 Transcript_26768/m.69283 type:complete len:709 (+) Transcript_26768:785-2911(+)
MPKQLDLESPVPDQFEDNYKQPSPTAAAAAAAAAASPNTRKPLGKGKGKGKSKGKGKGTRDEAPSHAGTQALETIIQKPVKPTRLKSALESPVVHLVVCGTIVANAVQIGVELDTNPVPDSAAAQTFFILECSATAIFTVECFLRIYAERLEFFRDSFNLVDLIVVAISWVDVGLQIFRDENPSINILQMLRLLRLLRILRILRVIPFFQQLVIMGQLLQDVAVTTVYLALILVVVMYAAAIFAVETVGKDTDLGRYSLRVDTTFDDFNPYEYFGTVGRAMYTLFVTFTLADLDTIGRPLLEHRPFHLAVGVFFVLFTGVGLANVIVGIIVQVTLDRSHELAAIRRSTVVSRRAKQLAELQSLFATGSSGTIGLKEVQAGMVQPHAKQLFEDIGIPPTFTAVDIMGLLDERGLGSLSHDEFMMAVYRLMEEDAFASKCVAQTNQNLIRKSVQRAEVILDMLAEEYHLDTEAIASQLKSRLQGLHGGDFDSKMHAALGDVDRVAHRHGTLTSTASPKPAAASAIAIPQVPAEHPDQVSDPHKEHHRSSPRDGPTTLQLNAKIEQVHAELQKDTHRIEQKIEAVSVAVEAIAKKLEAPPSKKQPDGDALLAKLTEANTKQMNRLLATLHRHGEQMMESTLIHSSRRPEEVVSDFKAHGVLLSRAMGYREDYQAVEQQLAKQEEDEEFLEVLGSTKDERAPNGWMTTRSCT